MTNTESLIAALAHSTKHGVPEVVFAVGRYTGNGAAVVGALRRRGYLVERTSIRSPMTYTLKAKPCPAP